MLSPSLELPIKLVGTLKAPPHLVCHGTAQERAHTKPGKFDGRLSL
jgi:hypothetical protein